MVNWQIKTPLHIDAVSKAFIDFEKRFYMFLFFISAFACKWSYPKENNEITENIDFSLVFRNI